MASYWYNGKYDKNLLKTMTDCVHWCLIIVSNLELMISFHLNCIVGKNVNRSQVYQIFLSKTSLRLINQLFFIDFKKEKSRSERTTLFRLFIMSFFSGSLGEAEVMQRNRLWWKTPCLHSTSSLPMGSVTSRLHPGEQIQVVEGNWTRYHFYLYHLVLGTFSPGIVQRLTIKG